MFGDGCVIGVCVVFSGDVIGVEEEVEVVCSGLVDGETVGCFPLFLPVFFDVSIRMWQADGEVVIVVEMFIDGFVLFCGGVIDGFFF